MIRVIWCYQDQINQTEFLILKARIQWRGKTILTADENISADKSLIFVNVNGFGNINFSDLSFDGQYTKSSAIKIEAYRFATGNPVIFDGLSINNSEFKNFNGTSVIFFDESSGGSGKNLTVKSFTLENCSFVDNEIIDTSSIEKNGSLFRIDAEESYIDNINIDNNSTSKSIFTLKTSKGTFSNSEILNNKSSRGISFQSRVYTDITDNKTLLLSGLEFKDNEVQNINSYNT